MTEKKFNILNSLGAAVSLIVSAVTYLLTIEPSASFWDCGEFIASSYKLEVGHPPGNPVFQLFARIFTMFGDNMHAAVLVNSLSAICSALTIFLLYLTIVWFVKRLISKPSEGYSLSDAVLIVGSGLVGSLAYCFSDTFWFSAVEGEVYAMSSLFTALVFWAMTKWYDSADEPYANRWIVLIAFLMGLSIGVHLLNLLAIPALVFMFYYRRREDKPYKFWESVKIFAVGVIILALILYIIIPLLPKFAAYVDLFFVNALHLPYNSGAAFFLLAILGLCFWGIFSTLKKNKVFWNTVLLCLTTIIVGFSLFSIDIIRSCAKTPTNEYQPDNAFTLVRYLSREQYGSTPLVYGQYFDAPYDLKQSKYYAPLGGKYKKVDGPVDAEYKSSGKMLFPRMWSSSDPSAVKFYEYYTKGKGQYVKGADHRKPTMGANLAYFFDYQLNWMYWRYFMWNFVGRQNEIHSPTPGDIFHGNWESGIKFMDSIRLGDQEDAPAVLKENKGKNHYFFLPLLLGLIGLCFQFGKDKRGCWLNFLMFFMTGIAIVIYLNQPPYQVRERDYAYAGSFYFFSVWIGLAVAAVGSWIKEYLKSEKHAVATSAATAVLCLLVPVLMACQNWDDHDRSGRKTAVEVARNYLNSVGPNGFLVTHGDNDTFPLWYAQEVENVRTDVRICNTSLLGTDWHIDQMRWACNESAPLPISVPHNQYLYGTNEYVPIYESEDAGAMYIGDVIAFFKDPKAKVPLTSGRKVDYIPTRKIIIPVNKENVLKYGILSEKYADQIPSEIVFNISKGKDYLTKPELFLLDLLAGYEWDRPLHFLSMGGDLNVGEKDYLEYVGYSYKFVPIKSKTTTSQPGFVDPDELYELMTKKYCWDALSADNYFIDYQNCYTSIGVMSVRNLFLSSSDIFLKAGQNDRALEMIDKGLYVMRNYPTETIAIDLSGNDYMMIGFITNLYALGEDERASKLAIEFGNELLTAANFYLEYYHVAKEEFEMVSTYISYMEDTLRQVGKNDIADSLKNNFMDLIKVATGK